MRLTFERRYEKIAMEPLVTTIISLTLALFVGTVIFLTYGANPIEAYLVMAKGAFGSTLSISEVIVKAIPLMLTGLAVAIAATMLLWNIGCEGQFVFGALGATWAALYLTPGWPAYTVLPSLIACGAIGGMVWALIPAILKTYFQVSEILTTLLLNYVAIIIMEHLYFGPWRDPGGMGFPGSALFPDVAALPRFFDSRIHLGLLIAITAAISLHILLKHSKWGFRIRVIGKGAQAAEYANMNVNIEVIKVMAISGALAGLAGMSEVAGIHLRLQEGLSVGYGYDGIIVACLAGFRPKMVPIFAIVLGGLIIGGEQLQSDMHLPASIVQVLEGALLLGFLLSGAILRYRLRFTGPDNPTTN
ncbi:ABC transporter permease [Desulforhopalus sp. 52FAK]